MGKDKSITWSTKQVNIVDVRPTPNNYKIATELGKQRLAESLNKFGLAGTAVVNTDMFLIDGNSRLEEAKKRKQKRMWVSMPSRKLTPKEFKEMSAMFDFAKAGEVDVDRIKGELGTAKKFYEEWGLEVPMELLKTLGSNAKVERQVISKGNGQPLPEPSKDVQLMLTLFYTETQQKEFVKLVAKHGKRFKSEDLSVIVFKVLKAFK